MKLRTALLALAFLAVTAAFASRPDDEEDPYLLLCGQADEAIAAQQWQDAVDRLNEAISIRPNAPQNLLLMSNLGMIYSYMGRDSLAIATLDETLRQAPALKTALANRARVKLRAGLPADAMTDLDSLLKIDHRNVDARLLRATLALRQGNIEKAEGDFRLLATAIPDSLDVIEGLARVDFERKRYDEAAEGFAKLVTRTPSEEFYAQLALCYLETDRLSEAAQAIAGGLERYPKSPTLYLHRARLNRARYRIGDAEDDEKYARKLIRAALVQ